MHGSTDGHPGRVTARHLRRADRVDRHRRRHVTRPRRSCPATHRLEDWRKLAEAGEVSPISLARAEEGLLFQIAEHDGRAAEAGIPPMPRGRIDAEAVATWAELDDGVAVTRDAIRTIADIRLPPAGKGNRSPFGRHRLDWQWACGSEHDEAT